MLSCSKGSRGLFVPLRVIGIFTDTTISPSSWLRQRPDHCTIRAGRNLPDKEFRYLRTAIVTAAVYRRFGSELAPLPLTYRRRAGVRLYTSSSLTSPSPVFLLNSRHPLVCAPRTCLRKPEAPFSRSYGGNSPSSFNTVLSSASVFSATPPVSVSGTVFVAGAVSWKSLAAPPIRSGGTTSGLR